MSERHDPADTGEQRRHLALDGASGWPAMQMRVRRDRDGITTITVASVRSADVEDVLLPDDEPTLLALAAISIGGSRAGLYARPLTAERRNDTPLVFCLRGARGAVRVDGHASTVADTLYARTRATVLALAKASRAAGREEEARQWSALGRRLLMDKRHADRGRSVRTLAGGLPTLGRRR